MECNYFILLTELFNITFTTDLDNCRNDAWCYKHLYIVNILNNLIIFTGKILLDKTNMAYYDR